MTSSSIKKTIEKLDEMTSGAVASVSMPLGGKQRRVEEGEDESSPAEFGLWANSVLSGKKQRGRNGQGQMAVSSASTEMYPQLKKSKKLKEAAEDNDFAKQMLAVAKKVSPGARLRGSREEEIGRRDDHFAQRDREMEIRRERQAKIDAERLGELESELKELQSIISDLDQERPEYADGEQNLTDRERLARDRLPGLRQKLVDLKSRIDRAQKVLPESVEVDLESFLDGRIQESWDEIMGRSGQQLNEVGQFPPIPTKTTYKIVDEKGKVVAHHKGSKDEALKMVNDLNQDNPGAGYRLESGKTVDQGYYEGVEEGAFDNASPMTKDTIKQDRIRSLRNLIAIAKKKDRRLRVQELELELKKLQGVAEDGIIKSIKRAIQGWDKNAVGPGGEKLGDPRDIVKRAKAMDIDTAKKVRAGLYDAPEHSPAGLQRRVLDRKLKGVAESDHGDTPIDKMTRKELISHLGTTEDGAKAMSDDQLRDAAKEKTSSMTEGKVSDRPDYGSAKERRPLIDRLVKCGIERSHCELMTVPEMREELKRQRTTTNESERVNVDGRDYEVEYTNGGGSPIITNISHGGKSLTNNLSGVDSKEYSRIERSIARQLGSKMSEGKTGPGLWANIRAKKERIKRGSGERMRKPGSPGAPSQKNLLAARRGSKD